MAVEISDDGSLINTEKFFDGDFGRIRTAQIGTDGNLYLLTANGNDDKIIRISETPLANVEKFTSQESGDDLTILYVLIGVVGIGVIIGLVALKRKSWFLEKKSFFLSDHYLVSLEEMENLQTFDKKILYDESILNTTVFHNILWN